MRPFAAFLAALAALASSAAQDFAGLNALDAAVPRGERRNAVVSPFALDADFRVFAVCAAATGKVDSVAADDYQTVKGSVARAVEAGKLTFLHARGFCVPDPGVQDVGVTVTLSRDYDAAVCRSRPPDAAEIWFRAMMEGTMEDFALGRRDGAAHYRSTVSAEFLWQDPLPIRLGRTKAFVSADGKVRQLRFLQVDQPVEILESREWSILSMRIAGDIEMVTVTPRAGADLAAVRRALPWQLLFEKLVTLSSRVDPDAWHGVARVMAPEFAIRSRYDLAQVARTVKTPLCGLGRKSPATAETWIALRFQGRAASRDPERPPSDIDEEVEPPGPRTRDVVLDHPFLFLFRHSATRSVLAAGQFTGIE